jgi:hypothetical protein
MDILIRGRTTQWVKEEKIREKKETYFFAIYIEGDYAFCLGLPPLPEL